MYTQAFGCAGGVLVSEDYQVNPDLCVDPQPKVRVPVRARRERCLTLARGVSR